jgi:CheY-like chemotaxis protein
LQAFAPVDVILLDLMFPDEITGYGVFDAIRANDEFSDVPIIAVSATDPVTAVPRCKQQGFAGFIAKPVQFETFVRQINQVLQGKEVWYSTDIDEYEQEGITHE